MTSNYEVTILDLLDAWADATTYASPLIEGYVADVEALGGTVSLDQLELLRAFLYDPYDNGAGSTLRVGEFIEDFHLIWIPLCSFAGITVPVVGSPLTNTGFVSGDLSTAGLQGDGTSYLTTALTLNQLSCVDFSFFAGVDLSVLTSAFLAGAYDGSGKDVFAVYHNHTFPAIAYSTTANFLTSAPGGTLPWTSGVVGTINSSATDRRTYAGLTNLTTLTASLPGPWTTVLPIRLFNRWTGAGATSNLLNFVCIGRSLTSAKRIALTNALIDLKNGMETL